MIHEDLVAKIRAERADENGFLRPAYGHSSLAELVPTIELMFGLKPERPILPKEMWSIFEKHRRVVLLLLDGFSFNHFVRYWDRHPFFKKMVERGHVFPLTSVFPSTTPAALTTIHTGLTPQEHGLPEWTVYFEEVGAVIETLPFRKLMTHGRDTLLETGLGGDILYHGRTIYQALREFDIPSHVFTYVDYAKSAYSIATQRGAEVVPYSSLAEMVAKVRGMLERPQNWGYFFVYWGAIDSAMHQYAPYSPQHEASVAALCGAFEQELFAKLPKEAAADTLFMLCADHGHIAVQPHQMIYLDELVDLDKVYSKSKLGSMIPPTGAPQDVFLFVPPEQIPAAQAILQKKLDGDAVVMTTKEAIDLGLFGMGRPSERFLRRVGSLLVLPKRGHHVWYRFNGVEFHQKGCHGGLSEDEMLVPFGMVELSDLL
jgi:predicted AlkP superfamily pyrophosphatase or phosphodiesterase